MQDRTGLYPIAQVKGTVNNSQALQESQFWFKVKTNI